MWWWVIITGVWVLVLAYSLEGNRMDRYLLNPKFDEPKHLWKLIINLIILSPLLLIWGLCWVLEKLKLVEMSEDYYV